MNALNLGSGDEPVVKKKSNTRNLKIILGLVAVILVPTIGSTLAGSITIGGDGAIEFGQGVVTTAACDNSIIVTPTTSYAGDTFTVSTIVVSDLDTAACTGNTLKIKVLSGTTPQVISTGEYTTQCSINIAGSPTYAAIVDTCGTVNGDTGSATGFTLTPSATLGAAFLDRITIESSTTP